jgi:cofilin
MTKFAAIAPQCEEVFDQVKETDTLDYVLYEASAHDKKISVAESGTYKDYTEFTALFKDDTPRYAVVDFKYPAPTGTEQRHKLVFITWYVSSLVLLTLFSR